MKFNLIMLLLFISFSSVFADEKVGSYTVNKLISYFNKNEINALKKFKNKKIILEGIVTLIGKSNESGNYLVNLSIIPPNPKKQNKNKQINNAQEIRAHNALVTDSYTVCQFTSRHKRMLKKLKQGDMAVIQGKFELNNRKLILKNCIILKIINAR